MYRHMIGDHNISKATVPNIPKVRGEQILGAIKADWEKDFILPLSFNKHLKDDYHQFKSRRTLTKIFNI